MVTPPNTQRNSPAPGAGDHPDQAVERELHALKQRYEQLKEKKIRAEQDLSSIRQRLEERRREALAAYGVAEVEELERLLAERRAENRRLVDEYRAHVESVSARLATVEKGETGQNGEGA